MYGIKKGDVIRRPELLIKPIDTRNVLDSNVKVIDGNTVREVVIEVIKEVEVPICTKLGECEVCCEENKHPYAVIPCGHARVCGNCLAKVRQCPECRGDIIDFIKIFV